MNALYDEEIVMIKIHTESILQCESEDEAVLQEAAVQ